MFSFVRDVVRRALPLLLTSLCFVPVSGKTTLFRVMSWNVENLFDCRHDSGFSDTDFLPEGSYRWTTYKYGKKIDALAKTIAANADGHFPDLIGLCEVENDSVMQKLTRYSILRRMTYRYIMTSGHDPRGIDVALIYNPYTFKPIEVERLHPESDDHVLRDILHVSGCLASRDTLDVYVCHLPSRLQGRKGRTRRNRVLKLMAESINRVFRQRTKGYVLVMGDFNMTGKELSKIDTDASPLASQQDPINPYRLYDKTEARTTSSSYIRGTYKYKGKWTTIDHILVSGNFLIEQNRFCIKAPANPVAHPFLLEEDRDYGGQKPFRTYVGPRYKGGISDHLPLRVDLVCE